MTTKHTPGPWTHNGEGDITHRDEQPIAFVNWTAYEEGQFNARLIAAAPDLLKALKSTLDLVEIHHHEPEVSEALTIIRAAIAKAEGGAV